MFQVGPQNPFKSQSQLAKKNMLTGFVESANINEFHFNRELRSFDTRGYSLDPTAHAGTSYIGDVNKANEGKNLLNEIALNETQRERVNMGVAFKEHTNCI